MSKTSAAGSADVLLELVMVEQSLYGQAFFQCGYLL